MILRIFHYLIDSAAFSRRYPQSQGFLAYLAQLPRWCRTMSYRGRLFELELPWIPFPAIIKLERWLNSSMTVLEFGSGASTLFFASRVAKVESVEHESSWAELVAELIKKKSLLNCRLHTVPPTDLEHPSSPEAAKEPDTFVSSDARYPSQSFENYVRVLDQFPDECLDIVLVDGRARVACCKLARAKVKPGGFVVLDNNDRVEYSKADALFEGWNREDVFGPVPGETVFSVSTFWKKPAVSGILPA